MTNDKTGGRIASYDPKWQRVTQAREFFENVASVEFVQETSWYQSGSGGGSGEIRIIPKFDRDERGSLPL